MVPENIQPSNNDSNDSDFNIIGNHAYMSQNKTSKFILVSQPAISKWIVRYKESNPKEAEFILQYGFNLKTITKLIGHYAACDKVNKEVKQHCINLLITFIDEDKTQSLFDQMLTDYHSQFFNRPKENLVGIDVQDGSFIYLIKNVTTGNLKIGYSKNPCRRLINLQQSTDCELKLLAFFEGTELDEQRLLTKYSSLNIRGEWFSSNLEIYLEFGLTEEAIKLNK